MTDKSKPGGPSPPWMGLGATGQFPEGKASPHDEGAVLFAIGERDDNVIVDFGTPVVWLGMPPEQAVAMAQLLIAKARIVARRQGKPLTVIL
jgi:hypothetical protein